MKKTISKFILFLKGWKVAGDIPKDISKCIIIAAPHTSNWDFVIGRAFGYLLSMNAKYLGKSQLFTPLYGWFFRLTGGIPVDRTKHNNLVSFSMDLFNKSKKLIITLSPEGTRQRVDKWKLGFYHIAVGAKIPIVISFLDYKEKKVGIGKVIYPSGNIKKDMQIIQDFYKTITPKYPELYNPVIF